MNIFFLLYKRNKWSNFVIFAGLSLFFSLILWLMITVNFASIETKAVYSFKGKNMYQISDSLVHEKETEFLARPDSLNILNNFTNELLADPSLNFYNITVQPIVISGATYEDSLYLRGPHNIDGKQYYSVRSIQVNVKAIELNNIQLMQGEFFKQEDYYYEVGNHSIPVVVGNEYAKYYKLGDKIDLRHYSRPFEGVVTGIIAPAQKVMTLSDPEILLDPYILLPATYFHDIPEQEKDVFLKASLLSRINGSIVTDMSPLDIRARLKDISDKTGFTEYGLIGANSMSINALIKMTEANSTMIILLSILTLAVVLCSLMWVTTRLIKNNMATYKVLLTSGADMSQIVKLVVAHLMFSMMCSLIVPVLLSSFIAASLPIQVFVGYMITALISISLLAGGGMIYARRTLSRLNIVQSLKE